MHSHIHRRLACQWLDWVRVLRVIPDAPPPPWQRARPQNMPPWGTGMKCSTLRSIVLSRANALIFRQWTAVWTSRLLPPQLTPGTQYSQRRFRIRWYPGRMRIPENEEVNAFAKETRRYPTPAGPDSVARAHLRALERLDRNFPSW